MTVMSMVPIAMYPLTVRYLVHEYACLHIQQSHVNADRNTKPDITLTCT